MSDQIRPMKKPKEPHPRSIDGFCERYGICRATFYNGVSKGIMPRVTKLGGRALILEASEFDWLKTIAPTSMGRLETSAAKAGGDPGETATADR